MDLTGIKRKSDGVIIGTIVPGTPSRLPDGVSFKDVEFVNIVIPEYLQNKVTEQDPGRDVIGNMARHLGMEISDFIEMTAKIFNIPMCNSCRMSKIILYSIRTVGWIKAIKFIFKTKAGIAFTKKEQLIIDELKTKFDTI